ncbi:MAG TPA: hypothetical protein VIJ07_24045 [Dermatophilaceae bacterium]
MNRRLAPAIVAVAIAGFAFVPATANAAVCAPGQTEQNTYPPCTTGISGSTASPGSSGSSDTRGATLPGSSSGPSGLTMTAAGIGLVLLGGGIGGGIVVAARRRHHES